MRKEITAKTKREFREKVIQQFTSPMSRPYFKFTFKHPTFGRKEVNIHRVDLTSCDREDQFLGIRAYDEEKKEYFFIDMT